MSFKKLLFTLGILFFSFSVFAANDEMASDVISVKSPLIQEKLIHGQTTAVFMELVNNGNLDHELVAATTPAAKLVQLHSTMSHHGDSAMQQISGITINPHKEKNLKPGGLHLMLMNIQKHLIRNQTIPITLIFNDGSWIQVKAKVVG